MTVLTLSADLDPMAASVLTFWLDEVGQRGWYKSDPAVDTEIRERFASALADAMAGRCGHWLVSAEGALAFLILLDQFSRNMYRGEAGAFGADARALAAAKVALAAGYDMQIAEPERQFFYLPLMHSERLSDQERCIRLIMMRMPDWGHDNLPHAIKHRDVIRLLGRFPSRNAALNRADTEAERAYRVARGYMS